MSAVLPTHLKHSDLLIDSVENPNYFGVTFSKITAEVCFCSNLFLVNVLTRVPNQIFYPINNTKIGSGNQSDITFHAHSQTNFTFPFTIQYQKSLDPSNKILADIATKCGFIGGNKTPITVSYKITVGISSYIIISQLLTGQCTQPGIKIAFITVSPTISNQLSFDCPLSESDISVSTTECHLTVITQLI